MLTPAQLWGCASSQRASGGRRDISAPPTRHFAGLDFGENMYKGVIFEKSCKMLLTSVSLGGCGPMGFFLGLCPLPSPVKEKCASSEASAEGKLLGEKVSLEEGWLHQDHPSPNHSDVTERVSPERLSQPFLNQHVTGT